MCVCVRVRVLLGCIMLIVPVLELLCKCVASPGARPTEHQSSQALGYDNQSYRCASWFFFKGLSHVMHGLQGGELLELEFWMSVNTVHGSIFNVSIDQSKERERKRKPAMRHS